MMELIATAESLEQGKKLIDAGVDKVIMGEEVYGLRLPGHFTFDDMTELTQYAHAHQAQTVIAANAILHNDKIETARDFLTNAKSTNADLLLVGDTGLIQILKDPEYQMPYIYDAAVLVTSPGQVNFWAKYGAVGSFVAREVTFYELEPMVRDAVIPLYYQVYGATCIHQSKRNLLENYFNYTGKEPSSFADRHLFISEPNKPQTHYSIYEDSHGTHVFANNDLNLLPHLDELVGIGATNWYFDGIYSPGQDFVEIVKVFVQAREYLTQGTWSEEVSQALNDKITELHPHNRGLGTGFLLHEPGKVK